ncbi:hypothetical protein ACLOJK_015161 [Asimina triloba]
MIPAAAIVSAAIATELPPAAMLQYLPPCYSAATIATVSRLATVTCPLLQYLPLLQ